jgi:hypothetical protein
MFNPMVVLYAATGMTEAMFLLFFIGVAYFFVRWMRSQRPSMLAGMALMTAGAFGVRYEALALAAGGALALAVVWRTRGDRSPSGLIADLLLYLTPVAYAVLVWIGLSYTIVGDGLYFLRGEYSAATLSASFAQAADDRAVQILREVRQSPVTTLLYVLERLERVFPAFAPVVVVAGVFAIARRRWGILGLVSLACSVAAFHAVLLYGGSALHFLRYYLDGIAGSFIVAPAIVDAVRPRLRAATLVLIASGFALSGAIQVVSMADLDVGREEYDFVKGALNGVGVRAFDPDVPAPNYRTYADERAVTRYLDERAPNGLVLLDTVYGAPIVLFSGHPERFVTTSDRDFLFMLERADERISYVLIPAPSVKSGLDRINRRYPDLYYGGSEWLTLDKDWGGQTGWRLYRVTAGPP